MSTFILYYYGISTLCQGTPPHFQDVDVDMLMLCSSGLGFAQGFVCGLGFFGCLFLGLGFRVRSYV